MRRSGARAEALSVIRLIGYLDTILYQNSIVVVDRINLLDIKALMHVGELLACIVAHWVSGYWVIRRFLLYILVASWKVRTFKRLAHMWLILIVLPSRTNIKATFRENWCLIPGLESIGMRSVLVVLLLWRQLMNIILVQVLMLGNLIFLLRAEVVGDDFNIVDSGGRFELLKVDLLVLTTHFLCVSLVQIEPLPHYSEWPLVDLVDVMGRAPIVWATLLVF